MAAGLFEAWANGSKGRPGCSSRAASPVGSAYVGGCWNPLPVRVYVSDAASHVPGDSMAVDASRRQRCPRRGSADRLAFFDGLQYITDANDRLWTFSGILADMIAGCRIPRGEFLERRDQAVDDR